MVRPRLSDSFDSERAVGDGVRHSIAEYLETIALLQEEVARLEQELQLRDESASGDGVRRRCLGPRTSSMRSDAAEDAAALATGGRAARGGAGQPRRDDRVCCSMS